jgi:AcrR family transcriptional regulator
MKQYDHLRAKAIELRTKQKLSLDEIVDRLQLPRTTIYYWIKDLPIPSTEKQTEHRRKVAQANTERYRQLREAAYQDGRKQALTLFQDPAFRDFIVLYMAEGYRRNRNEVSLANSNPNIVKLAKHWITHFTANKVTYSLQCHVDNDVAELQRFWGETLNVKADTIIVIRKSNSGSMSGRQWRSVHGVLTVKVGDTYLRSRIQAWMDYIQETWRDLYNGA